MKVLESIICKTINVRVRVRHARRPLAACIPSHPIYPTPYIIGGWVVGVWGARGLCGWDMIVFTENFLHDFLCILDYCLGEVLMRCGHIMVVMRIGTQPSNHLQ